MSDDRGSGGSGDRKKPVVRGQRRRRTEPPGPEGRERAEAPRRRDREDRAAFPPSRTDWTGAAGTGLPLSLPLQSVKGLPVWLLIGGLAVICCYVLGAIMMMGGRGGIGDVSSLFPSEPDAPFETTAPAGTSPRKNPSANLYASESGWCQECQHVTPRSSRHGECCSVARSTSSTPPSS